MHFLYIAIIGGDKVQEHLEEKMDRLWQKSLEEVAAAREESLITIPTSTDGVDLTKWISSGIKKVTSKLDQVEKETGVHCVCGEGCSACCRQAIQVLPTEAKAIAIYMSQFAPEIKESILEKVEEWKACIEASGLDIDQNKYYISGMPEEEIYRFMADYFALNLPCPLLSEEGSCMIYPVRPGGCWSYRVYSNPTECKGSFYVAGGMKHDEWERYLLDCLFKQVPSDHEMKLLPQYIEQILKGEW